MKAKQILAALMGSVCFINIFVPFVSASGDPYESLPSGGTTVVSNEQLISKFGTNGEFDWEKYKTQNIETEKGKTLQIQTKKKVDCSLDLAVPFNVYGDFNAGDVGVISFIARATDSTNNEARIGIIYQQNNDPWDKLFNEEVILTSEWKRFNLPIAVTSDFPASKSEFVFWVGYEPQIIQVADFSIINYKKLINYEDLTGYEMGSYKGRGEDASWRKDALARIEQYRKGDIDITVTDADGYPVKNADVSVNMTRNAFNFGTAVTELLWNTSDTNYSNNDRIKYKGYFNKYFNTAVAEGAMKWDEYNASSGNDADNIVKYLNDNNKKMRGHCLYWDKESWFSLASGNTTFDKKESILNHVKEMVQKYPNVIQWDVINEPVLERYLRNTKSTDFGISFMADIFKTASANTNAKLYLNELNILGKESIQSTKIKDIITELKKNGARVDGLGLETHCGGTPASPEEYYNQLCDLSNYVDELAVTEYDLDVDDEQLAADHLRDMLIVSYSHPKVNSFLIWGFWDKKHWKNNAPLFKSDWTKKAAANVWEELVLNRWVTRENGTTDNNGKFSVRGYLGTYDITVKYDGEEITRKINMDNNSGCSLNINIESEQDVSEAEILASGTEIINNDDLLNQLKNSDGTIGTVNGTDMGEFKYFNKTISNNHYAYQNAFGKCEGIKFEMNSYAGYNKVSDAKISVPINESINDGDICIVTFNAQKYYSPDGLAYVQFALRNDTGRSFSSIVDIGETFGWQTTNEFNKLFAVPIVSDGSYDAGSSFDIYLGFNNYQQGFIGGLTVKNLSTQYSKNQIQKALGIDYDHAQVCGMQITSDGTKITFSSSVESECNLTYAIVLYNDKRLVNVKLLNDVKTDVEAKNLTAAFSEPGKYTVAKVMAFENLSEIRTLCKAARCNK